MTKDSAVVDMTQGNILKLILGFALPLFLGNVFQQLYSLFDTMIAGYNLGNLTIAAIGSTSSLYAILIDFASGFNSGCAIVVTQSFGAHNRHKVRSSIAGMIEINVSITVLLTLFTMFLLKPLMHFLNVPTHIFSLAYTYLIVLCVGMFSTIAYNMFSSILRSFGNSLTSLYFLILSSVLNIIMDYIFVVHFNMGIFGLAFSTVLAQTISAICCGGYVWKFYKEMLPLKTDFYIPKSEVKELVLNGISMAIMYCIVDFGSIIFQSANNQLGAKIISAHTASRRVIQMMMQPLVSMSSAVSTFVAQNYGAQKMQRIHIVLKEISIMILIWSIFSCVLAFVFGNLLLQGITGTTDKIVIGNAVMSLRWHLSFFPALGGLLTLRTSMQAMGLKIIPVISSGIELLMKIVSAIFIIPKIGFFGTCITEPFTWLIMFVFLLFSYRKWRRNIE